MPSPQQIPARPSAWWMAAAVGTFGIAVTLLGAAVIDQRAATRPVGEGELFLEEAASATSTYLSEEAGGVDPHEPVIAIRNALEIEAVSVIDDTGLVVDSTSASLVGTTVQSPFIAFANSSGTFAAAATPTPVAIAIDGRVEWSPGDTLYEVLDPLPGGGALLLHYDISELLERRTASAGLSRTSITLAGAAAALLLIAGALVIGRIRATARFRSLASEARLLEVHNAELEDRNTRLDEARAAAERALDLAEEKNRIRAEFVLMINHELRTPLTSVITGTRLLAETVDLDEAETEVMEAILEDGTRLEQMIAQILAVARIENRGLVAVVSELPASAVWAEVTSHLPGRVDTSIDTDLEACSLLTDASTLGQLTRSLVDNAFTHGASTVRVAVSASAPEDSDIEAATRVEDGLFILVADDGPGIDPAFLPRAFEKFEKDSFSSGTGLGLYVARLMAEAIGSSISVTTSSAGTTMSIGVPSMGRTAPLEPAP